MSIEERRESTRDKPQLRDHSAAAGRTHSSAEPCVRNANRQRGCRRPRLTSSSMLCSSSVLFVCAVSSRCCLKPRSASLRRSGLFSFRPALALLPSLTPLLVLLRLAFVALLSCGDRWSIHRVAASQVLPFHFRWSLQPSPTAGDTADAGPRWRPVTRAQRTVTIEAQCTLTIAAAAAAWDRRTATGSSLPANMRSAPFSPVHQLRRRRRLPAQHPSRAFTCRVVLNRRR